MRGMVPGRREVLEKRVAVPILDGDASVFFGVSIPLGRSLIATFSFLSSGEQVCQVLHGTWQREAAPANKSQYP